MVSACGPSPDRRLFDREKPTGNTVEKLSVANYSPELESPRFSKTKRLMCSWKRISLAKSKEQLQLQRCNSKFKFNQKQYVFTTVVFDRWSTPPLSRKLLLRWLFCASRQIAPFQKRFRISYGNFDGSIGKSETFAPSRKNRCKLVNFQEGARFCKSSFALHESFWGISHKFRVFVGV